MKRLGKYVKSYYVKNKSSEKFNVWKKEATY